MVRLTKRSVQGTTILATIFMLFPQLSLAEDITLPTFDVEVYVDPVTFLTDLRRAKAGFWEPFDGKINEIRQCP